MMGVVVLSTDLMDRSRISAAVPSARFVRDPAELAGEAATADAVVVDLGVEGVLDVLADVAGVGVRTIGYGSHVDRDVLEAARAAGVQQVMARSAFFSQVAELLT